MPPPEVWGPPIWTFLHTLAEKVNEDEFPKIKLTLFSYIKRICNFLPCPECSSHAYQFLARVNINAIKTKNEFKNMLYIFHNTVNKRKRKQLFNYANINKYKNYNVGATFNNFISVYHTKGNMNLIAESFQRNLLVKDLKNWLINNHKYFRSDKKVSQENNEKISETTNETNNETNNETTIETTIEPISEIAPVNN
jgi:hypothetical protein